LRKAKPVVLGFEQPCSVLNTMKNGIPLPIRFIKFVAAEMSGFVALA